MDHCGRDTGSRRNRRSDFYDLPHPSWVNTCAYLQCASVAVDKISRDPIPRCRDQISAGVLALWWRLVAEKALCSQAFGCTSKDAQVVEINPQSSTRAYQMPSVDLARKTSKLKFLTDLMCKCEEGNEKLNLLQAAFSPLRGLSKFVASSPGWLVFQFYIT